MAIYDFFLSRNNGPTINNYVGHSGRLFYDSATGEIRISDGTTAGGLPISITIATANTVGGIRPGAGFTVSAGGVLSLAAGPMFELDVNNVFQLKVATSTQFGGVKLGPGVIVNESGQIIIDSEGLDFSFGDLASTVGTYTDSTAYAVLQTINADEDMVLASNGNGGVRIVGEFRIHPTNGLLTETLESQPGFVVKADGQVSMYVTQLDAQLGAVEIIGSDTGDVVAPGINGTMLHVTGQRQTPCRVYIDGNSDYVSLIARRWNGNFTDGRTQVLANDYVLRINATAQTDAGMGSVAMAQISIQALENQTTTAQGSKMTFTVTPVGVAATSRVDVLTLKSTGIELPVAGTTIKLSGSTSGTTTLQASAIAGTTTVTLPATTGTVVTTGDTGTVINTMLAGSIANAKLANSTISGIALGSNLAALSAGSYLTGTDYTGATARTFAVDATTSATASKVVARDANGAIAATNTTFATREAGSFGAGQTITINMATDYYVHATITSETVTVAYTNITAGRQIYLLVTNASGADQALDSGIPATRMTNAKAIENMKNGGTSRLGVISFGTTVASLYGNFEK